MDKWNCGWFCGYGGPTMPSFAFKVLQYFCFYFCQGGFVSWFIINDLNQHATPTNNGNTMYQYLLFYFLNTRGQNHIASFYVCEWNWVSHNGILPLINKVLLVVSLELMSFIRSWGLVKTTIDSADLKCAEQWWRILLNLAIYLPCFQLTLDVLIIKDQLCNSLLYISVFSIKEKTFSHYCLHLLIFITLIPHEKLGAPIHAFSEKNEKFSLLNLDRKI